MSLRPWLIERDRQAGADRPAGVSFQTIEPTKEKVGAEAKVEPGQPTEKKPGRSLEKNETLIVKENLPSEFNLAVPFTSQAPKAVWDEDHKEFCEEASILMARRFFEGEPAGLIDPDSAETELQAIKAWQLERLGAFKDTTAEKTAIVVREKYRLFAEVVVTPDLAGLKTRLLAGELILLPANGRALKNPYFRQPGPIYHMLVIRGFTQDGRLIVNDPGTKRGEAYLYQPNTIFEANGDWSHEKGEADQSLKRIIVIGR